VAQEIGTGDHVDVNARNAARNYISRFRWFGAAPYKRSEQIALACQFNSDTDYHFRSVVEQQTRQVQTLVLVKGVKVQLLPDRPFLACGVISNMLGLEPMRSRCETWRANQVPDPHLGGKARAAIAGPEGSRRTTRCWPMHRPTAIVGQIDVIERNSSTRCGQDSNLEGKSLWCGTGP